MFESENVHALFTIKFVVFTHTTLSLQLCLILFIIFWTVRVHRQSFIKHFPQIQFKHFDI